ncbi:hypothetical protein GCM10027089_12380 [Nocardia thraciensis]
MPGGHFDVADRYVEPTVLYPSEGSDPALQQEVFRSGVAGAALHRLDEVVQTIKDKPKPLVLGEAEQPGRFRGDRPMRLLWRRRAPPTARILLWALGIALIVGALRKYSPSDDRGPTRVASSRPRIAVCLRGFPRPVSFAGAF